MWLKISAALFGLLGLYVIGYSIFASRRALTKANAGSYTNGFEDMIFKTLFNSSPVLLKRILMFLLGGLTVFISIMVILYG